MEDVKIEIISDKRKLNQYGCDFFIKSMDQETLLTSTELRWLTIKKVIGRKNFYVRKQKVTNEFIKKCITSDWKRLNLKILLYKDPKKLTNNDHIQRLIKAGAEIRVLKMDNIMKICLSENRLFISFAPNIEQVVNKGIYYTGKQNDDPIIDYYKNVFRDSFAKARKLIVKNDKLFYDDKWYIRFLKTIKAISQKEILLIIISVLFGSFITYILEFFELILKNEIPLNQ